MRIGYITNVVMCVCSTSYITGAGAIERVTPVQKGN